MHHFLLAHYQGLMKLHIEIAHVAQYMQELADLLREHFLGLGLDASYINIDNDCGSKIIFT
jgi:hypothetical protein